MKDALLKFLGLGRESDYPDSDAKRAPWWVVSLFAFVGIFIDKVFVHSGSVSMVVFAVGFGIVGGMVVAAIQGRRTKQSDQ